MNALESRRRRPLPSGLGRPGGEPDEPLIEAVEIPWLQPFPDALLGADPCDPANVLLARGKLRLAIVAAMQFLPARQRAAVILRDVLEFSAAEVAEMLETTSTAVNSALQRARSRLNEAACQATPIEESSDPQRRALVDQYITAFERGDIATLKQLLTADVVLEMPPIVNWFVGREAYGRLVARAYALRGSNWRMIAASANGQPAVAAYSQSVGNVYDVHSLQIFTVSPAGINRNTVFQNPRLFPLFDLPVRLELFDRAK